MNKILGTLAIGLLLTGCDIDQKQQAKLPDVDVDVDADPGQLPTFDVDWADVEVGTRTTTVKVPKVVVVMEEEEVEVPYVDVDMPDADGNKEEMTLAVEAEVTGKEHKIDIKEIVATEKNLYVFSELEELDQEIGDQKLRVSDQVVLNAPEDLNVKYIINGERPDRVFNSRYKYVSDIASYKSNLKNGKTIYKKDENKLSLN
ncbi:hypothetical protein NBT05_01205 [Aquimarina sp. ERC-38]|uniref:hypothetical protein n=1 Tax=Aquimarina sp. ERC-38 TaxID=2949996 RepID=UPI0022464ECC|nr:hypothetical protein [Aquimarina sp. ERC-38]UZO81109.1 hypothetical protein NBT05_01205 [Aquimarina sp. ERC-38]